MDDKDSAVKELTQTCSMLQAQVEFDSEEQHIVTQTDLFRFYYHRFTFQVQQLQGSMRDILQFVSSRSIPLPEQWAGGVSTQTEITAVHTPQGDSATNWPYQKAVSRPCSLSLTVQNNNFKNALACGGDKKESSYNENKCSDASDMITSAEINLPGEVLDSFNGPSTLNVENKVKSDVCVNSETETTLSQDVSSDGGDFVDKLNQDCLGVSTNDKTFIIQEEIES